MSTEVTEDLVVIPKQMYVLKHVRDMCACRDCEKHNINTPVIKAEMPNVLYRVVYHIILFKFKYSISKDKTSTILGKCLNDYF